MKGLREKSIDMGRFRDLYPFRSNYLDINGFRYHYLDEGTGDPMVMVHGNPTWSFYYRRLVREFSSEFRTIVPDHIGCGLSDKPGENEYDYRLKSRVDNLGTLLDRIGATKNITLVGHDWGGMIAMAHAVQHADKIRRIILMNTAAFPPPGGKPIPIRLRLVRNISPIAVPAVLGLNLFSYGALYMATRKGLSPGVKAGLSAPYNCWKNRIATLKFVQDIPTGKKDPSYYLVDRVDKKLKNLAHIPMLIIWGLGDFVFDQTYFDEWRRRFPRAETHAFGDAGHYVLEDKPDEIVSIVSEFLKKHSP